MRSVLVAFVMLALGCEEGSIPAGRDDAGGAIQDATPPARDASTSDRDASAPGRDASPPARDASPPDRDASTMPPDAGPVDPLEGASEATLVDDGYEFLEGPLWRDGVLLFTDIPASTIYALTPPSSVEVFRAPSAQANGLATLPDGGLLAAEHEGRRVSVTETDGRVVTFADRFEGSRFNSPNDLVVRSDGTVYFTDPPFGLSGARELDFNGVFRVAPDGSVHAEHRGSIDSRPNGVALSPDERVLYVADTAAREVRAHDVAADGSTSGERVFASDTPNADGMTIDVHGNLYVSTSDGIAVFAPDGARWGTISIPQVPANCAFGGGDRRTLYVTAGNALYSVRLDVQGR